MEFRKKIADHANREPTQEVCGFVLSTPTGVDTEECANIAADPTRHFLISPALYLERLKSGNLMAFYHSHPTTSADLSPEDIGCSDETGTPMYVFSVPDQEFRAHVPEELRRTPIFGRPYLPLVYDCVSLVQDYFYQTFGISTGYYPRTFKDRSEGSIGLLDYMKQERLERVTHPLHNDVLVMNIRSPRPNHCAVYLGDSHMLHQVEGHSVTREVYGGFWEKNTSMILRHPAFK